MEFKKTGSGFGNKSKACTDCGEKSCAASILGPEELNRINLNSRETTFRKGSILIHEGSMTSNIIYLRSGLVKEYITCQGGREQILQIVKKYTYLGLPSLFGDNVNHYAYAALTDVKVCYIDVSVFMELIRSNGNFATEILISVSRDSLNNFHRFMSQSQKKTFGRVADALLYFSRIIFEENTFELPFTRQEFADLIGVSRESATRVLQKFVQEGLLTIHGRKIGILKTEMLERISRHG